MHRPHSEARTPLPPPLGRLAWALLGTFAAALALLGVLLPILPGPPFAVLAALCFANVSPRIHDRLATLPALRDAMTHWRRARHRSTLTQFRVAAGLSMLALLETLRLSLDFGRRMLARVLSRRPRHA
ncbi:MAG: DUF454 family protein [Pseudomonadales bacterium]|jgi:uncharacterized membrane protein YbaN (DUF454 family)|nr:DUF454 family protein [Pseudomonadales bacterium]